MGWGGTGGREEVGGEVEGAVVRPPNGSILLQCEACTFLTRYNKSINGEWVCSCVRAPCMKRKLVTSKQEISPSLSPSIDVTVTLTANSTAHHNTRWHMPHNGNALYH